MKKVSISAATFTGNRGAEAMLTTIIGRLREKYADAEFEVFSYYPRADKQLVKDPGVHIHSSTPCALLCFFPLCLFFCLIRRLLRLKFLYPVFPKAVLALAASDLLIDIAGVSFIDGREKYLPFNVLSVLPAMILGVPVIKFAQAIGPFHSPLNRFCAKFILKRCRKIFARGQRTYDNLAELGLDSQRTEMAADVAFLHRPGDSLTHENEAHCAEVLDKIKSLKASGNPVIGICPSAVIAKKAVKTGWDYAGFIAGIMEELTGKGCKIVLFPNATREDAPNKLHNNDLPVIRSVMERMNANSAASIVYVQKNLNNDSIRQIIERCDIGLVSRFHAMVAALSLGVPVIVMGWSHKYLEVMEQFDQARWVFDYAKSGHQALMDGICKLIESRAKQSETIQSGLKKVKSQAEKQFEYVFDLFGASREKRGE